MGARGDGRPVWRLPQVVGLVGFEQPTQPALATRVRACTPYIKRQRRAGPTRRLLRAHAADPHELLRQGELGLPPGQRLPTGYRFVDDTSHARLGSDVESDVVHGVEVLALTAGCAPASWLTRCRTVRLARRVLDPYCSFALALSVAPT